MTEERKRQLIQSALSTYYWGLARTTGEYGIHDTDSIKVLKADLEALLDEYRKVTK